MNVCEDRTIGTHNLGVCSHSHVGFRVGDRFSVRGFQSESQPDEMIGNERRRAALPNHFVAVRQNSGRALWRVADHLCSLATTVASDSIIGKRRSCGGGIIAGECDTGNVRQINFGNHRVWET